LAGTSNSGTDQAPSADRPVIGISCYREQAQWGMWNVPALVLPLRYADRVTQAGGIPVLLPPVDGVADTLSRVDGLVLSGGRDIDPARYDAERSEQTEPACAERDEAEIAMFGQAMSLGLPVLGICRGLQLINVARGGSLHQHLPDLVGHDEHSPLPDSYGSHEVRVAPGTQLAGILGAGPHAVPAHSAEPDAAEAGGASGPAQAGPEPAGAAGSPPADGHLPVIVPTHHHQAVDRPGKGLVPTAWAADGMVEALELDRAEHSFVLAVQWHPEAGGDLSLFRALIAAAAGRAR